VERSDILRLWILREFGGVYIDCDFQPMQSLDLLLEYLAKGSISLFAGMSNTGIPDEVNNGFIGSVPGHPFLSYCLDEIKPHPESGSKVALTAHSVFQRTGPLFFTEYVSMYLNRAYCVV